ncbi:MULTISPECIES: hypothetical protein [Micromonospora]|uniref:Uncharacterized protein n=1 Tax=Micromonospora solifontis TaxID=2487138 RepID=A0ABX9WLB7_9ACTN|nr:MULTISPECIES: hypothetical protein [Micromonospora]NES14895.1 hypothetical protein [Micromonospora sp. PPF5-17B]NES35182.1 hypothetical protein [Micromonospora solifontis]NES55177.1 hypothetical protein [Micromonospora sp. PPF5-6]RNM01207.1 hypothetical protein EFE23_03235 [Micromonospora solifontis]
MSFDLFVWHEPTPISAAEARAKLDRWGDDDRGVFAAHPAVLRFHEALLRRFPALEDLTEQDIDALGVWSMTPDRSDSIVVASCVWSRADEVWDAVVDLATEHGLVCYEPGYHLLNPNAPGYTPAFVLTAAGLPTIPDPDGPRLQWTLRRLDNDNHFAVLDRADGWWAQAGYGPRAGAAGGTWAIEYREGAEGPHYRTETTDISEAVEFLQGFLTGDSSVRQRHAWQRLI